MGKVYTTDEGTLIKLDTGENLSTASVYKIIARSPDGGAVIDLTVSVVETTKVQHIKTASTLNKPGTWDLQAYVEFPAGGGKYRGEKVSLVVHDPIT